MLPVDELDKKKYTQILEESISNIPRFTDEWTDFSEHDPGITILEMLTWLTDMQRYYLNRITLKNKLRFLELYGVKLENQKKASTYVQIACNDNNVILPSGAKLQADEQIFETKYRTELTDNKIERLVSSTEFLETDNTHVILNKDIVFYPFDSNIKAGNMLYIGFCKELETDKCINIYFEVVDDCPVKINNSDNITDYHSEFSWMSYSQNGKWNEIEIIKDETNNFLNSGNITIKLKECMSKYDFFNDNGSMYWICIKVKNARKCLSPKIKNVALNCVCVINQNTFIKYKDFKGNSFKLYDNIYLYGNIAVSYKTEYGYVDLSEDSYELSVNKEQKYIQINILSDNNNNEYRIICYADDLIYKKTIGLSNGLSYQKFYYPLKNVVAEELVLQVAKQREGNLYWDDYHYVADFSLAGEDKRVFEIDLKNQMIIFGDNENSILPDKFYGNFSNIRIINLVYSDKLRGNIRSGEIKEFVNKDQSLENLTIVNAAAAVNGRNSMDINDGISRLFEEKNKIYRAISLEDYKKIVLETPGLRVSMAKALLDDVSENTVKIIFVPYTYDFLPEPDTKMLSIVKSNLDKYRLITTQIRVEGPKYIGVSVTASISVNITNRFSLNELKEKLKRFLTPIGAEYIDSSYDIGKKVLLSDIIEIISSFDGVNYIDYIRIDGKGEGVRRDSEGNLAIPYNGISFADNIEINIY